MGIRRPLHEDPNGDGAELPPVDAVALGEWLDYLEIRRQALIVELRAIDRPLIKYGRLRAYTLPKRIK